MLQFKIDKAKCIKCKKCIQDCPMSVIDLVDHYPAIYEDKEETCLKCQHCLAICPTGALSILDKNPEDSVSLTSNMLPEYHEMALLIKGRRSIRQYKDENINSKTITDLINTAFYAPTGVNAMKTLFTVIDNKTTMHKFRDAAMLEIRKTIDNDKLPDNLKFFEGIVKKWEEKHQDIIFRNAPHMIIVSTKKTCPTPMEDAVIALCNFELLAQCAGIGTLWNGMAKWTLNYLTPNLKKLLNLPEDHSIGFIMIFGKPAVKYYRTVQKNNPNINIVKI
ncbi:MAG TPA: nitroreductase family protein [Victivallales bacterium]|nr:nitroreductase family protein [Victivallales bacterium]